MKRIILLVFPVLLSCFSFSQKVDKYRSLLMMVDKSGNSSGSSSIQKKECDVIITFEPSAQKIKIFSTEESLNDDFDILKYDSREENETLKQINFNVSMINKRGTKCNGRFGVMTATGEMWVLTVEYPSVKYTYLFLKKT